MRVSKMLLVLTFALTACMPQQDKDKDKEESAPVPVEVTRAGRGDISTYLLSTTTIDSESKVDVYPKHSGPIVAMRAEEGDLVQPGQLLAQIDPAEQELRYKQAASTFDELKASYARLETMHKNKMTSQEAYDASKFAFEKAKIAMDMAKLDLDNTRILSPIRGMVITRGVRFGERVTPATLAYSIMDMQARIAEVHIPESEIARIRPGLSVELRTDALADKSFPAKVRKISPAVDPRSGTVKVTVDLEDPELMLRPGMFVRANIVLDTHKDVVLLPRGAVVNLDNKLAVFVVRKAPAATATPVPAEAAAAAEAAQAAKPAEAEATRAPEADADPAQAAKPADPGAAQAAESPQTADPKKPRVEPEVVERVFFEAGYQNEKFVEALSGIEPADRLVHVGQQGLQPGAKVLVMIPAGNGSAEPQQGEPKDPTP